MRKDGSLTIRIPRPLKEAMERVADAERRTLSQMVELAMEQFLEARHEWPPRSSKAAARRR